MAWDERQYYRERTGGFGSQLRSQSVVTWLLIINAAAFMLGLILSTGSRTQAVNPLYWGNFNVEQAIFGLQIWRFFTYQFLHAGFLHVLFNLIGLYFFGPMLENWWGSRRFLAFYLLCGVSGAVLMTLLSFIPGLLGVRPETPLIGASGAIFGILVGAAVLFPHQRVMLLIPPVPMTLRTMALIFLGLAVLSILAGSANAAGEAAHLGGAILGYVLTRRPGLLGWAEGIHFEAWRERRQQSRRQRERQQVVDEQLEVDRILDKVRQNGLQSLTRSEKKTLNRATERKRRAG